MDHEAIARMKLQFYRKRRVSHGNLIFWVFSPVSNVDVEIAICEGRPVLVSGDTQELTNGEWLEGLHIASLAS